MSYHPIELDKVRNLRYGMKALSLIEKKLKKPISQIDMDNLTMEDAAVMIAMGKAFAEAFGVEEPEEEAKNE